MSKRYDLQSNAEKRNFYIPGLGYLLAWDTTTPTNGLANFAPGCIFQNVAGSVGSLVYVNVGSKTSATWLNIA